MSRAAGPRWRIVATVLVGAAAGFLSGLFGVGGGIIIVPALMAYLAFDQRRASGTSLLAIAPSALVGAISYGVSGNVDIAAATLLAAGSVIGVQAGVWLLRALPERLLPWVFVGFVALVITSLWVAPPTRHGDIDLNIAAAVAIIGIGLAAGVMSGLVGVGGGVVVVPGLELVLGAGDLLAKGTSLLMMVPTSTAGTITNILRRNVHVQTGVLVGVTAAATTPTGAWVASALTPTLSATLFSGFLLLAAGHVLYRSLRRK